MHIGEKTFDNPLYLRPRPNHNRPEVTHGPSESLQTGLNSFLDAVNLENKQAPREQTLVQTKIDTPQKFVDGVENYVNESFAKILNNRSPQRACEGLSGARLTDAENVNHRQDLRLHNALSSFRQKLCYLRETLRLMQLHDGIRIEPIEGENVTMRHDGNVRQSVQVDAVQIIDSKITRIDSMIKSTTTHQDLEAKYSTRAPSKTNDEPKAEPQPAGGISDVEFADHDPAKSWSGKKILGVSALSISGLALLGLGVYLYDTNQRAKHLVQNTGHRVAQGASTVGYAVAPGIVPNPMPTPSALGFAPGGTANNLPYTAAPFNPNPLYSYPA